MVIVGYMNCLQNGMSILFQCIRFKIILVCQFENDKLNRQG